MQSLVLATQEASTTDSIQRLIAARNRGRGRGHNQVRCSAACTTRANRPLRKQCEQGGAHAAGARGRGIEDLVTMG